MHEVEVNVVQTEHLQTLVQTFFDSGMVGAPELGCDKDIFALDARLERLGKTLANLCLVAIDIGAVNVSVAALECVSDGFCYFARRTLPCSETGRIF